MISSVLRLNHLQTENMLSEPTVPSLSGRLFQFTLCDGPVQADKNIWRPLDIFVELFYYQLIDSFGLQHFGYSLKVALLHFLSSRNIRLWNLDWDVDS